MNENYEVNVNEEIEDRDVTDISEDYGFEVDGPTMILTGLVATGVTLVVAKRKEIGNWFTNQKIKSLEKKGFKVEKTEPEVTSEDSEEEASEE